MITFPLVVTEQDQKKADITVWSHSWALNAHIDTCAATMLTMPEFWEKEMQENVGVHIYDGGLISLNLRGLLGFDGYIYSTESYF